MCIVRQKVTKWEGKKSKKKKKKKHTTKNSKCLTPHTVAPYANCKLIYHKQILHNTLLKKINGCAVTIAVFHVVIDRTMGLLYWYIKPELMSSQTRMHICTPKQNNQPTQQCIEVNLLQYFSQRTESRRNHLKLSMPLCWWCISYKKSKQFC